MKNKRAAHGEIIKMFQKKVAEIEQETENNFLDNVSSSFKVYMYISNIYVDSLELSVLLLSRLFHS